MCRNPSERCDVCDAHVGPYKMTCRSCAAAEVTEQDHLYEAAMESEAEASGEAAARARVLADPSLAEEFPEMYGGLV